MSAPHGSPARSSWESAPLAALEHGVPFADRHIGPDAAGLARMLETIGVGSLEELADTAMPSSIRTDPADWSDDPTGHAPPPPATEAQVLDELRGMAARNTTLEPMLGLGYHGTLTPPVIRRNVLEDPAWYTAYTPYQPEISQGRLEALLNFQTMVCDLTGLDVAGASMLDESTAAAEAMLLLRRADKTKSQPLPRRRRHAAPDRRGAGDARRGAGDRAADRRRDRRAPGATTSSVSCSPPPAPPGRCATTAR